MAEAALSGFVFLMRRHGARLPAKHVGEPVPGHALLIDRYGEQDRFYVRLYHPGQFMDWSHELHGAWWSAAMAGCTCSEVRSGSRASDHTECKPGCAYQRRSEATRSCRG